jgi:tetratricopeptide (TPR) repeat protein
VESPLSEEANTYFWEHFHLGQYDSIPAILEQLTTAYLDNPNDFQTVLHLGFTHFWAIAERYHLDPTPASIIDHAILAQKYLGEAYKMNPEDTRILSFLSAAKIIVGDVSKDDKLVADGYFNGLKSIRDWKDFGEFSLAYTLSQLPHTDPNFQKALQWMKSTTERCYCSDLDPPSEACKQFIGQKVDNPKSLGRKRIVPNSWVAPHNIEGYFMSYGDLLVKSGNWEQAIPIYELAKYAPDYENWPYRDVLERRIRNAQQNVDHFRKPVGKGEIAGLETAVMLQTAMACRACHQMSPRDLNMTYSTFDRKKYLDKAYYFLD